MKPEGDEAVLFAVKAPRRHRSPAHDSEAMAWLQAPHVQEEERRRIEPRWAQAMAHVAETANESGFFAPEAGDWLRASFMSAAESRRLAARLEELGALCRYNDRLYVAGWRDHYRIG